MRYLLAALLSFYTLGISSPAFADCSCDSKCQESCVSGKGHDCKCSDCECAKTGKCKHGKCHHEEKSEVKKDAKKK